MNSIPTNKQMSTESPLVIHTGSLLSNLDQETQARVLGLRYIKHTLVEAKALYAQKIQRLLFQRYNYDMHNGILVYAVCHRNKNIGDIAGYIDTAGCRRLRLDNCLWNTSHLIFLIFTGRFLTSKEVIDHIDGDRLNDNLANLRCVSYLINNRNRGGQANNSTGYTGVYRVNNSNKFFARVKSSKIIHLGCFPTAIEAFNARQNYLALHPELGYTTRHGK